MINSRLNVFETNSSSTHSVSIGPIKQIIVKNDIPRNYNKVFEIHSYKVANGDEEITVINKLMSEVSKASFIFSIIGRYLETDHYNSERFQETFSRLCGSNELLDLSDRNKIIELLDTSLIFTKWIKDVIFEETNTYISFIIIDSDKYTYRNWFPYMYTPYDSFGKYDYDNLYYDILDSLENQNEEKFKSIVREVIFNKDIIIVDRDDAHCSEVKEFVL